MKASFFKKGLLILIIISMGLSTGCWNYREVEELAIIGGVALDKNEDGSLHLTVETVDIAGGTQGTYEPEYIEIDGKSVFEAARRGIMVQGKKLYWSHAKAIILSKQLAEEDITKYLDFFFRDQEAREDTWLLISKMDTAKEVLMSTSKYKNIVSFQIDDTMRSQRALSKFPDVALYEFFDRLFYKNVSPILPVVSLSTQPGDGTPKVGGAAVIRGTKLEGFMDEDETLAVLWLRDEVKGGYYHVEDITGAGKNVTLDIFRSKSKIKPIIENGALKIKADIRVDVYIAEIEGNVDVIKTTGRNEMVKQATKQIERDILAAFTKARDEYKADIFGFGREIDISMPYVWQEIKNNWDELFLDTELSLDINIRVKGTASTRTPLLKGEK